MIILEKPYVSELLLDTIRGLEIEVLGNEVARNSGLEECYLLDEKVFIQRFQAKAKFPLYTNSENSIPWIQANLAFSDLPDRIETFKNKARFRNLLRTLFPDFWYKEVSFEELPQIDITDYPKPATGYLSLGE